MHRWGYPQINRFTVISEIFSNHYMPSAMLFIQLRGLFQRLKFSAAGTLAKLKRFDIGLKVFIFDGFEPNRKNWDLVDRDCLC